jgi:hypothetical protein
MIYIAGTGRSGTTYLTHVLNKYLPNFAEHEPSTREGFKIGVGYGVFYYAKPNDVLWLCVREPLSCISSLAKLMSYRDEYAQYSTNNTRGQWSDSDLKLAMSHYLYWNAQCEMLSPYDPVQIEEAAEWLPDIVRLSEGDVDYLGLQKCIDSVDKKTNTRKRSQNFTWEDLEKENELLALGIMRMAERYGYE